MTTTKETIVAFHMGRGGRFHNAGHLSFIGEHKIAYFISDLFLNYEKQRDFAERFGYDSTFGEDQRCIVDLIANEEFEELEKKFGITKEQLGEAAYYDGGGHAVGLTQEEEESGIGMINIDNDYDTTYTKLLSEIDEEEAQAILNNSGFVTDEIVNHAKKVLGEIEEAE